MISPVNFNKYGKNNSTSPETLQKIEEKRKLFHLFYESIES